MTTPRRPASTHPASRHSRPPMPAKPTHSLRVPLAIGCGALVVLIAGILLVRGGDDEKPSAAAPSETAASTGAPAVALKGVEPAATVPAAVPAPIAPPVPTVDKATIERELVAVTTAAAAVQLGDRARKDLNDEVLADACFEKALAIDPNDAEATRRLDVRDFDPSTELPGFDDLNGTKVTYRMQEFAALFGTPMSRPQRRAATARWTEARKVLEARLDQDSSDSFTDRIDSVLNQVRAQPFFKELDYEVIESTRPYALIVQVKGDEAARKKRVSEAEKAYAPFLAAYDKKIHSYLFPLSPDPPKKDPSFITFILLGVEDYNRYSVEVEGHPSTPGVRAHYEFVTKRAITWSPILDTRHPAFAEGCQVLLHELTHAWVDKLASYDGGRTRTIECVKSHWFNEGIAEYMSCHFLEQDGSIKFQPWRSMRISESTRKQMRIPLKDALKMRGSGDLHFFAKGFAEEAQKKGSDPTRVEAALASGFYADMSLFICWLNHADHGASRERFQSYAQEELRGEGSPDLFAKHFDALIAGIDLEQTLDGFAKRVASGAEDFDPDED